MRQEPQVIISLQEYEELLFHKSMVKKEFWVKVHLERNLVGYELVLKREGVNTRTIGSLTDEQGKFISGYKLCIFKEDESDNKT